ncbi:MAG: hypothetical protein P1P88_18075 [Bacteroidales bacterium]|nr:hypothetical protein [Bacteroidales bacterium]
MSKKKKKPSAHQIQKLAGAQYKKEFFRKFRFIFNVFCNDTLFQQIPSTALEKLYNFRSHYFRLVSTKEKYLSNALIDSFKTDLAMMHKNNNVKLNDTDVEISVYDYLTAGLSLKVFGDMIIKDNDFPAAKEIREGIAKFKVDGEIEPQVQKIFVASFETIAYWNNDIAKCQYWFRYEIETPLEPGAGICNIIYVHSALPQITSVVVNGIARPAILFEWAQPQIGPQCVSIKPSSLNIDGPFADIPMKVYIQKHALQRLAERVDSLSLGIVQYFMYLSFTDSRVFYDHHNNLLVEYRIAGIRAGYFRVDIVEGIVIVRTFLFITNNDTPEGQLLEKNTGLQKTDKKYLAMDKLSTFMSSDIGNSKEFRKIIDEAGCHSLIELHETLKDAITKKGNSISEQLLVNYLNKDNLFETFDSLS